MERPQFPANPNNTKPVYPVSLSRSLSTFGPPTRIHTKTSVYIDPKICKEVANVIDFENLFEIYNRGPYIWPVLQECVKFISTTNPNDPRASDYYIPENRFGFCIFLRSLTGLDINVSVNTGDTFITSLLEIAKLPMLVNVTINISRNEKSSLKREFLGNLGISFLCNYCIGYNVIPNDGVTGIVKNDRYASNIRLRFEEVDIFVLNGIFTSNFPGVLTIIGYRLAFFAINEDITLNDEDYISLETKEEFDTVIYRAFIPEDIETLSRLLENPRVKRIAYEARFVSDKQNLRRLMDLDLTNIIELYVPIPIVNLEELIKTYPNIQVFQVTGALTRNTLASGLLTLLPRYPHIKYIYIVVPETGDIKSCIEIIPSQYCNKIKISTYIYDGIPGRDRLPTI